MTSLLTVVEIHMMSQMQYYNLVTRYGKENYENQEKREINLHFKISKVNDFSRMKGTL